MKKCLVFITLLLSSIQGFAANDVKVCSQLTNKTGKRLDFIVDKKFYMLENDKATTVFSLPDASNFILRNGVITVYAGSPQITQDGEFNMQFQNQSIPSGSDCVVSYMLYIYK